MQNIGKYQIINEDNFGIHKLESELCILSFRFRPDGQKLEALIAANPNVQFWISLPNMSREDIIFANQMGINNVLPYPLNEEIIDAFLYNCHITLYEPCVLCK